jgi:hypothetical protein
MPQRDDSTGAEGGLDAELLIQIQVRHIATSVFDEGPVEVVTIIRDKYVRSQLLNDQSPNRERGDAQD